MKLPLAAALAILTPACVTPLVVDRWKAAGDRPGETVTRLELERGSIGDPAAKPLGRVPKGGSERCREAAPSIRILERRTARDVQFLSPLPYCRWDGPDGGGPAVRLEGDERAPLIADAVRAGAIEREARVAVVYDLRGVGPGAAILVEDGRAVVRSRGAWAKATVRVAGRSAEAEVTAARARLVPWFVPAALADGVICTALLPFLPALYVVGQGLGTGCGCR